MRASHSMASPKASKRPAEHEAPQESLFAPHQQSAKYPKLIQKHLARKNSNLGRAVEALRTPSRQFSKKEIRRLSELAKTQHNDFDWMVSQSSSKKKQLLDEERLIQSELSKKGIDVENPVLDISSVFVMPSKCKRRKRERESMGAKFCGDPSDFLLQEDPQAVSMFEVSSEDKLSFPDIPKSLHDCSIHEMSYTEPEILFKEINNLGAVGEFHVKELEKEKGMYESDGLSFSQERCKGELKVDLGDKENELLIYDDPMETGENRAPYVPPPFAKVFGD